MSRGITDAQRALRKMSMKVLRENLAACCQARKDWKQLAAGKLDEKPDCPFCDIDSLGDCENCALSAFEMGRSSCGDAFYKWRDMEIAALGLKYPLRSKACREAAAGMVEHIAKVRHAVAAEIKRRTW